MLTVNKTEEQTTKNIVTHKPFWVSYNFLQILYALYGNVIMIIFFFDSYLPISPGGPVFKTTGLFQGQLSLSSFWGR